MNWYLLLPQLPASPSTLRVMVWRRMRAAGAIGLQNGVWILPQTTNHKKILEELLAYIREHEATGFIFEVGSLNHSIESEILERFRADRDEEYIEFCERCDALLGELERESSQGKFTYAELEETETDLDKLKSWYELIRSRDIFGGYKREEAERKLEQCQVAYQIFTDNVYTSEGINLSSNTEE